MIKKVLRSNAMHKRLENHHNEIVNRTHRSKAKSFWSIVKRDYHNEIRFMQKEKKRILTNEEKKILYKDCVERLAAHRYSVPSLRGIRGWVPKKYRSDKWVRMYYGD